MNKALTWDKNTNGHYCLSGTVDRDTVPQFWDRIAYWYPKESAITLNLAEVKRIDSAGMAMLLHLHQQFKNNNQTLTLCHIPIQLSILLKLSNVENLLVDDMYQLTENNRGTNRN
ncbi:STAS domain-containing protein [Candidatus Enterovibrio altilux]|uniref:Uncharacterized protein YrbB n=1 Tax=Candidatus Enterovibrio altilux TaxID=1927128 RepID=A0A291B9U7_9GAMM|nr:STAS domain-containing protein [Candidatus Enterovibrio luxaltus]ATF09798.1 Uncharacterized protein YrbB [Candidatus Enterovibrio luxaltus]